MLNKISAIAALAIASLSLSAHAADITDMVKDKTPAEVKACVPTGHGWAADLTKVNEISTKGKVVMLEMDKYATIGFVMESEEDAKYIHRTLLEYNEACTKIQLEKAIAKAERNVEDAKRTLRQKQSSSGKTL